MLTSSLIIRDAIQLLRNIHEIKDQKGYYEISAMQKMDFEMILTCLRVLKNFCFSYRTGGHSFDKIGKPNS